MVISTFKCSDVLILHIMERSEIMVISTFKCSDVLILHTFKIVSDLTNK